MLHARTYLKWNNSNNYMLKCIIYKVFFKRHGVEIAAFFRKVEILMTLQTVVENRFAKALQNEDNIF